MNGISIIMPGPLDAISLPSLKTTALSYSLSTFMEEKRTIRTKTIITITGILIENPLII
jgi:hypothetical protein